MQAPGKGGMPVAIWNQFNPRERLSVIGAALIIVGWIVALTSFGAGASTVALLGAIVVIAVIYVKHAPNMSVTWPIDPSLINLGVSGLVALLVLLDLLRILPYLGGIGSYGAAVIITIILEVVGAAVMLWGSWQEYQVVKPAMPNMGAGPGSTPSAPPPAAPPSQPMSTPPPAAQPPAAPPADDMDDRPPA
jgi:hypothetical protein